MPWYRRLPWVLLLVAVYLGATITTGYADPLDDAQARLGSFLQRAGFMVSGLVPLVGILAIGVLSIRRNMAKAAGEDDVMSRSMGQIYDVLKLVAIGAGASLLVAIAGSVLK